MRETGMLTGPGLVKAPFPMTCGDTTWGMFFARLFDEQIGFEEVLVVVVIVMLVAMLYVLLHD